MVRAPKISISTVDASSALTASDAAGARPAFISTARGRTPEVPRRDFGSPGQPRIRTQQIGAVPQQLLGLAPTGRGLIPATAISAAAS